ncbi:MAG: PAS domain S-box protein, partial [Candidatus Stygibacter frigidus]|nr:PAS domain S-box protein [Candidatus Stygibacter frigidus]
GNVWDLTDPNGVKIIQKQHEAFDNPNGVFTRYSWRKLGQLEPSPKISFTKAVPELDWIIGTGVYLEDVNKQIDYQKKQLRTLLQNRTFSYLALLLAYFLLSFLIIKHFSSNIKSNIESFTHFFSKASDSYENIELQKLHYSEFKEIASAANIMIDKRKKSEEALKISENKYKELINTTSEGFWMVDPEMITIEVNKSICRMLEYSPEDIIGKSPVDFVDDNDQQIFLKQFNQSSDMVHNSYEMNFTSKSGKKIPCLIKATHLYDQNNEFYASFAFITDITDRKENEQKLNDYQEHLEDLIKERTKDLEEKNKELNRYNKLFIGREYRIKELRDQVKKLEDKLDNFPQNNS